MVTRSLVRVAICATVVGALLGTPRSGSAAAIAIQYDLTGALVHLGDSISQHTVSAGSITFALPASGPSTFASGSASLLGFSFQVASVHFTLGGNALVSGGPLSVSGTGAPVALAPQLLSLPYIANFSGALAPVGAQLFGAAHCMAYYGTCPGGGTTWGGTLVTQSGTANGVGLLAFLTAGTGHGGILSVAAPAPGGVRFHLQFGSLLGAATSNEISRTYVAPEPSRSGLALLALAAGVALGFALRRSAA